MADKELNKESSTGKKCVHTVWSHKHEIVNGQQQWNECTVTGCNCKAYADCGK